MEKGWEIDGLAGIKKGEKTPANHKGGSCLSVLFDCVRKDGFFSMCVILLQ